MEAGRERTGGCLCGGVRYKATPRSETFGACHCGMCRRWSAGPYLEVDCAPGSLKIEDRTHLGVYRSSEWAERMFCSKCGSSLFYHFLPKDAYSLALDTLDDLSGLEFAEQIFVDEKPAAYSFAEQTTMKTREELMAALNAVRES